MTTDPVPGKVSGGVLAMIGGVLGGLGYLVLPVVDVPFVGGATAPTLARLAPDARSLGLLPAVAPALVLAVVVGCWLMLSKAAGGRQRLGALALLLCGVIAGAAYLLPFVLLQGELDRLGSSSFSAYATTFTGSGFWVTLIGATIVVGGGVLEVISSSARARPGGQVRAGADPRH